MSFSKCSSQELVIVIHQSCQKQGQLCLHMPSTEFAHAQFRVNMTQTIISRVKVVQQQKKCIIFRPKAV